MSVKHEFKIIGKPLHPNKRVVVFELCQEFIEKNEPIENDDWKVLREVSGIIELRNKHTLEFFECKIIYIHL